MNTQIDNKGLLHANAIWQIAAATYNSQVSRQEGLHSSLGDSGAAPDMEPLSNNATQ